MYRLLAIFLFLVFAFISISGEFSIQDEVSSLEAGGSASKNELVKAFSTLSISRVRNSARIFLKRSLHLLLVPQTCSSPIRTGDAVLDANAITTSVPLSSLTVLRL